MPQLLDQLLSRVGFNNLPSSPTSPDAPRRTEDIPLYSAPTAELQRDMLEASQKFNINPTLLDALIQAESSWNPKAQSKRGAQGLAQLMPRTARSVGVTDPFDAKQSIHGGANYLKQLMDRFGDTRTAVAAYNAGPTAVGRSGIPDNQGTQDYLRKILGPYPK